MADTVEPEAVEPEAVKPDPEPVEPEPVLDRIRASWPGYTRLCDRLSELDQLRLTTPMVGPNDRGVLLNALADELLARDVPTSELVAGVADAVSTTERRIEQARGTRIIVDRMHEATRRDLDLLKHRNIDPGLQALDGELQDLMGEIRSTADVLADIRTAEQALRGTTDQHAAFLRLDHLADMYVELRAAQAELTTAAANPDSGTTGAGTWHRLALAGQLRNLDEVWPDWWRREGMSGVVQPAPPPPWPSATDPFPHPPLITIDYLLWLATADVEPWIPTTGQLTDEVNRLNQLEQEHRHDALRAAHGMAPVPAPHDLGRADAATYAVDHPARRRGYQHLK